MDNVLEWSVCGAYFLVLNYVSSIMEHTSDSVLRRRQRSGVSAGGLIALDDDDVDLDDFRDDRNERRGEVKTYYREYFFYLHHMRRTFHLDDRTYWSTPLDDRPY